DPLNNSFVGVLLLQPVIAEVNKTEVNTGAPIEVSGNLQTACDRDTEAYAFEDWQTADGVRLVMAAWPARPAGIQLPARDPAATWRNRLVYTVFDAEAALARDDRLPWEYLGVPLGLAGFDTVWKPLFVDRRAVVRAGG